MYSNSSSNSNNGKPSEISAMGSSYPADEWTNATQAILSKTGRNLLHHPSHPLAILKDIIFKEFPTFAHYDALSPVVSTVQNFDSLGFSKDHPGRSKTDTYYINESTLLRTHTSAHQLQLLVAGTQKDAGLLKQAKNGDKAPGNERFLVAADVYRRDEIDSSHYPVFHQMEGVCTFSRKEIQKMIHEASAEKESAGPSGGKTGESNVNLSQAGLGNRVAKLMDNTIIGSSNPKQPEHAVDEVAFVAEHMKQSMNRMVIQILTKAMAAKKSSDGQTSSSTNGDAEFPVRWIDAYFPFTSPSWEMEVLYQGEWLEICGCGVMKQEILDNAGMSDRIGWAFGFGLERLAMLLFGIPDIRLFWSTDPRFTEQFLPGQINTFRPFSRHPSCTKDVSFWLPSTGGFHENDVMDLVRETAGDLVEGVKLIDSFTHPKTGKTSHCYRINYCSMDRNVTNEEINEIQEKVRDRMVRQLGVTLR
ncbi:phenylalanyl-tRNA synthetase alpha subunit, mitochondrial [Coemansia sp. RSA 1813]|nr:phenylalanyl-tRNA synthetase alpha subunit, mitochondrial [Coemansia sp. RSA 1646]KAJ2091173.1 phenylalanyl-tRNA synthetase alpha subunit, mitochondrial [Coemansia sp. RSA 986]KAJ2571102.1 phenylalanyl-tRNA synthetase alpha subunit, mitochondrial [Coemansia sp. RSA 1813]